MPPLPALPPCPMPPAARLAPSCCISLYKLFTLFFRCCPVAALATMAAIRDALASVGAGGPKTSRGTVRVWALQDASMVQKDSTSAQGRCQLCSLWTCPGLFSLQLMWIEEMILHGAGGPLQLPPSTPRGQHNMWNSCSKRAGSVHAYTQLACLHQGKHFHTYARMHALSCCHPPSRAPPFPLARTPHDQAPTYLNLVLAAVTAACLSCAHRA